MDEAAARAGMTTRNIRLAMQRPWAIAYMRQQRALLVEELSASNPHHLRSMRTKSPNEMAKLGAARLIEDIGGGRRSSVDVAVTVRAGFVLDLREPDDEKQIVTIPSQPDSQP